MEPEPQPAGEPGAPPPAEPSAAPPVSDIVVPDSYDTEDSGSWFSKNAFKVSVFGKQISGRNAQQVIYTLAVFVAVLLIVNLLGMGGGGEPAASSGAGAAASGMTHGGRCRERTPGGEWTCAQQKEWGKCDVEQYPWMRGYCCETCQRCADECTSVYNFHVYDETAPPSLLLSYDFNEGGGDAVLDASGMHGDIDLTDERHLGAAEWVSKGVCGSALEFSHPAGASASDSGTCVRTPSFDVNRGLTTSLWVFLHSAGGDSAWGEQILNVWGAGGPKDTGPGTGPLGTGEGSTLVLEVSDTHGGWRLRTWNPTQGGRWAVGARPVTNRWVHLAGVYDDSLPAEDSLILYVDGIPYRQSAENSRNNLPPVVAPMMMRGGTAYAILGCHWHAGNNGGVAAGELGGNGVGHFFDGILDEVRIFDDALSQAQIHEENIHDHCTPLLAFWGFNGRHGQILEDAGPYHQDIDITGGRMKFSNYNSASWAQQGVCGSALEFMNDEHAPSCLQTPAIPFTKAFTISLWAKMHTVGRDRASEDANRRLWDGEQVFNCGGGTPRETIVLEANIKRGIWRARIWNQAYSTMVIDGPPVNVGQWTHLALVYDQEKGFANPTEQAILYVDGAKFRGDALGHYGPARDFEAVSDQEHVWANRLSNGNSPAATCSIGCHGSGRSYFDGLIDEVRVHKGALATHAVLQDYKHAWCETDFASADYVLDGLLAFHDFNEGEGDVVSDSVWGGPRLKLEEMASSVSWITPGVCGSALEFYSVGEASSLQTGPIIFNEAVTLSLWVYVHASGEISASSSAGGSLEQVMNCNSNFLADGTTGYTLAIESVGRGEAATWQGRINSAGEPSETTGHCRTRDCIEDLQRGRPTPGSCFADIVTNHPMTKADCDAVEGGRGVWVGDSEPGRAGLWVQSTPGSLVFGTWQHLALVHNPAAEPARNLILYVDGQEYTGIDGRGLQAGIARGGTNKCTADASVADPSGPFCEPRSWSNGLRVGPTCGTEMANGGTECQTASCSIGGHPSFEGWANAHGMYFDGLIDEVRIFDHALTPGEVSQEAVHYWCDSLAESAPLLQYTFDEGGGLTVHDESPYHNDLSIAAAEQIGHAAWSSNGICNHALEFDTENGGDCVQGMPIPIAESVTFSMWVYLHDMVPQAIQSMHCKSVNASPERQNFVFGTTSDQSAWMTRIWSEEVAQQCAPDNDGEPCKCGNIGSYGGGDQGRNCGLMGITGPSEGTNSVTRNTWVHLAAVYDQTGGVESDSPREQYILYINGQPYYNDQFISFMPNRMFGGLVCEIGCRIQYSGNVVDHFDGLIDEVRVLERALTAQEIQTEMSMPWCSPMILHLGFNEGHGHTIHDSSANRLDVHLGDESPFHAGNVLSGEPAWATGHDAVCGTAMELKGNATTDVGDCFEIEGVPFGQAVTISMWAQIRTGGTGGPGGGGQLVNCHGDGGNGGGHSEALVLESSAGNWQARTWLQGMVSTNPSPPNNAVQAPYEAGVWTHLTMVYDDSETPLRQLILYVDGRPYYGSAKVIWQNMLVGGGGFCSIGCHPGAGRDGIPGQAFFDGLIDEVRVYNGALSIEAVRNDYDHRWCLQSPPPPPPGSGLLLFYPFDEADGTWVGDFSGSIPPKDVDLSVEISRAPTVPSQVGWITPGVCGSALEFFTGGTGDCVETPNINVDKDSRPLNALTVSAWVFLHSAGESLAGNGGPQGSEQIANCHGGMSFVLEAFPQDQIWRVRTYNSAQGDHYVPGGAIVPNRWTHLAMVFNPQCGPGAPIDQVCAADPTRQTILYVDGRPYYGTGLSRQHSAAAPMREPCASDSPPRWCQNDQPEPMVWKNRLRESDNVVCTIGCHPGNGGQAFFDGLIDEVRIFDRALSHQEILGTEAQHSWCARGARGQNYHYTSFEEPDPPGCAVDPDPLLEAVNFSPSTVAEARQPEARGRLLTRQAGCENSFPRTLSDPTQCRSDGAGRRIGSRVIPGPPACEITTEMSRIVSRPHTDCAPELLVEPPGRVTVGECTGDLWVESGHAGTYSTSYVAGTNGNAELGFKTYWQSCGQDMLSGIACADTQDESDNTGVISMYNTGPSNGLESPPNYNGWGACNEGGTFGAGSHRLPHGTQCYMMDDTDGFIWVELDEVSLRRMENPVASIWLHLDSSRYEDSDAIRAWVSTANCGDVEIIRGQLNDLNHPSSVDAEGNTVQIVENTWQQHQVPLQGCGTATVKFGAQTGGNGGAGEEVWWDMVEIREV